MSRSKVTLAASAAATIGWLASGYTGSQVSRFGNGPANLQRATGVSGSTRPFVLSDMIELPKFITSQGRTDPCTHSEIDPCREKSRRNQKGLRNLLGPYSAIELATGGSSPRRIPTLGASHTLSADGRHSGERRSSCWTPVERREKRYTLDCICLTTYYAETFCITLYLGAIARTFPYITPKSLLARLAYCQKPCLTKFLTI